MKFTAFLSAMLVSAVSQAYQDGSYECTVDAFTNSRVTIKTVNMTPEVQVPYVHIEFNVRGVTNQVVGFAAIKTTKAESRDKTTGTTGIKTEESLYIAGYGPPIIVFGTNGEVSDNCTKR